MSSKLTDEVVRGPGAGRAGTADESRLLDFEEAQGARAGRGRVAVDLCKVVDDRAVVALWPGVPLELQSVSSVDRNGVRSRLGGLMASDVRSAEVSWLNETFGKLACYDES